MRPIHLLAAFAILMACQSTYADCPPGKNCPAPAPTLASPARKQAAPVKKLASKERSAVIKRGKSHLPAPKGNGLKPFKRCKGHFVNHSRPRVHGIGPRGWASWRHRH